MMEWHDDDDDEALLRCGTQASACLQYLLLLKKTPPAQAENLLHSLERAVSGIGQRRQEGIHVLIKEATSPHKVVVLLN